MPSSHPPVRRFRRAAIAAAGALILTACSGPSDGAAGDAAVLPDLVHVHGLGKDASGLYVATHTGLLRIDGDDVQAVGDGLHDLMGFTVAGDEDLLASGHPDLRDESLQVDGKPPLLGLVHSRDGVSWTPLSLLGDVDFHSLVAAHGRVYGADSTSGRFMVSDDRTTWEIRSEQLAIADFVVSPDDPQLILAATDDGIARSRDGGTTWQAVNPNPYRLLEWTGDGLYALAADGQLSTSAAAGESWQPLGTVGGPPEAFLAADDGLYVAVSEKGIVRSPDDGATFEVIVPAVDRDGS